MTRSQLVILVFFFALGACDAGGDAARSTLVVVAVGASGAAVDEALASGLASDGPGAPGARGTIELRYEDEASGAVLAEGRVPDPRRVVVEPDEDGEAGAGEQLLEEAQFAVTLPVAPSGRGVLHLTATTEGAPFEAELVVDPSDAAAGAGMPLVEAGSVGAAREGLHDGVCPEDLPLVYGQWDWYAEREETTPEHFHGCATLEHVGGAEDPTGKALVVIWPVGGWDVGSFTEAAAEAVGEMGDVDWFADHMDDFSFYAMVDPEVVGAMNWSCTAGGLGAGWTDTQNPGSGGRFFHRVENATYGPVEQPSGLVPHFAVGLIDGACSGWGNRPGPVLMVGTEFNCEVDGAGGIERSTCSVGARIAHEMGHALAALGDEYGFSSGTPSSTSRCPGGPTDAPNISVRGAATWADQIGCSPPLTCPDDSPANRSFVREAYDASCPTTAPCSNSIMRGFGATAMQFDPISAAAMTNALNELIGTGYDDGLPSGCSGTCETDCGGVRCGYGGCDELCEGDCSCADGVECLTALGAGVCSGEYGCANGDDLSGICPSLSSPDYGVGRCASVYVTAGDRYEGRWTSVASCEAHAEIDACLAALP